MRKHNERIDRLIDGWKDEIVSTLKTWIAVPSVLDRDTAGEGAPFGKASADMLALAIQTAKDMGFEAEGFDGYVGHAVLGKGEKTMGILAHLDVVPVGDGWTKPPFGGVVENGRMYGRGTNDDKGPALAALYALRAVRDAGVELKDEVRVVLGCDEETGSQDLRHYAQCVKMPDYGFSPDAEYPVINTEKGGCGIGIVAIGGDEEEACIPVYAMHAGERVNVVPGIAWAEVGTANVSVPEMEKSLSELDITVHVKDLGGGRARIEAEGQSAHASTPDKGVNAIAVLMHALTHLGAGGGSKEAIKALHEKVGVKGYYGEGLGIAAKDDMCGPLTCNMGLLRYDGRKLEVSLDIRYPLATNYEKMCGGMAVALAGTPLMCKFGGGRGVYHVPEESDVVQGLLAAYHDATGLPAYAFAIGGGTYSRMMPNTVAFGSVFPGEVECAHMPDENIELEKYFLTVKIMARAIEYLAGRD